MSRPSTLAARIRRAVTKIGVPILLAYLFFGMDWPVPDLALMGLYFTLVFFVLDSNLVQYPRSTVGIERRVDTEPVDGGTDCSVCDSTIETGQRRTYTKQAVLFGVPLWTIDGGENDYCSSCIDGEVHDSDGDRTHEPERNEEREPEPN
ncbi:hypothetical protein A4G99_09130 [Haladaptatus sp. R4]|uniref:hypothetical protein n=1 Tax=Haladaptatus sp. R4 TaxID=1679489 RepID=UPI0007B4F078|nr:hypothetical protein [Haladaptatus sp. R4]KZN24531.1 hypothetical protein A4G99_09130 [Haladaptatus sp. R4]